MDSADSVDILTDNDSALIGDVIDRRFCIESVIGSGAMSVVYKAHHLLLGRPAALKVMRSRLSAGDKAFVRFEREIHATSLINHPGIVRSLACGFLPDGRPYLVLEYIDGKSLRQVLQKDTSIAWTEAMPIFMQLVDAVQHAHECGVLHRDLKPENIMLVDSPCGPAAKIVDFGVVALASATAHSSQKVTTTNNGMLGSPPYMSPEICSNQPADERSDIYALGCVFYEMLTGGPPFCGETGLDVMFKHVHEPVPTLPRNLAPQPLRELIQQMLSKQANERPGNAAKLLEQLKAIAVPTTTAVKKRSSTPAQPSVSAVTAGGAKRGWLPLVAILFAIAIVSVLVWLIAFDSGTCFLARCISPSLKTEELELLGDRFRKEGRMPVATDLYAQAVSRLAEKSQLSPTGLALQMKRIDALLCGGSEDEGQQQCCDLLARIQRALGDDEYDKRGPDFARICQQLWWRMDYANRHKLDNPNWMRDVSRVGQTCSIHIGGSSGYPFYAEAVSEQKSERSFEGHEPAGDMIAKGECILQCAKPRPLEALDLFKQALEYRQQEFAVPSIAASSMLQGYRYLMIAYAELHDAKSARQAQDEAQRCIEQSRNRPEVHLRPDVLLDHWLHAGEIIARVSEPEAVKDYERAIAVAPAALADPEESKDQKYVAKVNYISACYYMGQHWLYVNKPEQALPYLRLTVKMGEEVGSDTVHWYRMFLAKNYIMLKDKAMAARTLDLAAQDAARLAPADENVQSEIKQLRQELSLL